jgi:hypothetical protein
MIMTIYNKSAHYDSPYAHQQRRNGAHMAICPYHVNVEQIRGRKYCELEKYV